MCDQKARASMKCEFHEWLGLQDGFPKKTFKNISSRLQSDQNTRLQIASGHVLQVDLDWRTQTLTIENLTMDTCYSFAGGGLLHDYVCVIGAHARGVYLAYCKTHATEVRVVLLSGPGDTVKELCLWDFGAYWLHSAMLMGWKTGPPPPLGTAFSLDGDQVVILGPSELTVPAFREHAKEKQDCLGCKHIHVDTAGVTEIPRPWKGGASAAVFNPAPEKNHLVTLVFSDRHEYCEDYSRPVTTGYLAIYDARRREFALVRRDRCASSEILLHSRDGVLLFVRNDSRRCVEILDADLLEMVTSVDHSVASFPPSHISFTILYPSFPLLSQGDTEFALLSREGSTCNARQDPAFAALFVTKYTLPNTHKRLKLKSICRRVIREVICSDEDTTQLPLPRALMNYLQWR